MDAMCEHGSLKGAARALKIKPGTVAEHVRAAGMKMGLQHGVRKYIVWDRYVRPRVSGAA